MYIDLTPELRALRDELRTYFAKLMTTSSSQSSPRAAKAAARSTARALEKMGKDGWLGIGWPKEYGGQDRTPLEQFLFADEVQRVGFPLPFLTLEHGRADA